MAFWTTYRTQIYIVLASAILDVSGRILLGFHMPRVSAMEAVLFGVAGVVLLSTSRRHPPQTRVRRTTVVLGALFLVAALRAGVWATTGSVFAANLVILAVCVAVVVVWSRSRRRKRRASEEETA